MSKHPWSAVELDVLTIAYPHTTTAIIAAVLKRSMRSVFAQAYSLGLKKSDRFLASPLANRTDGNRGGATRFKPGHKTWNKGMKGLDIGGKATRFKKGRPAHEARNYRPIGSLRINADGYLERKVTDDPSTYPARRWVAVHRLVWEATHGPVPNGHVVVFKPGRHCTNADNITLDDVELITRRELMARNSVHNLPAPLKELSMLRGQIRATITKRLKKEARHGREHAHQ